MSLIDDLRGVGHLIPPSHLPSLSELVSIVGGLIGYVEHGDSFLKASEEEIHSLFAGHDVTAHDINPATPAAPGPDPQVTELQSEVASLRQQLATAQAANNRTTVTTEPTPADSPPTASAEAPASSPAPPSPSAPEVGY